LLDPASPSRDALGRGFPHDPTYLRRSIIPHAIGACGHSEEGTGANYTHLRPEYLKDFIASTEAFWDRVGAFTGVHLRYQIYDLASARKPR